MVSNIDARPLYTLWFNIEPTGLKW